MRGQVWSLDMLSALIVLSALFGVFSSLSLISDASIHSREAGIALSEATAQAVALLVSTPGQPGSWHLNLSAASSLGIASSAALLDEQKVAALFNLSATSEGRSAIAALLALPGYNISIDVIAPNGTIIYSMPITPIGEITQAERLALLGRSPVRVRLRVWR